MLHAAGTDAAVEERKGSTGDHAGLIRLPLFPQNEFTVIEYKEKKKTHSSLCHHHFNCPCFAIFFLGGFHYKHSKDVLCENTAEGPCSRE